MRVSQLDQQTKRSGFNGGVANNEIDLFPDSNSVLRRLDLPHAIERRATDIFEQAVARYGLIANEKHILHRVRPINYPEVLEETPAPGAVAHDSPRKQLYRMNTLKATEKSGGNGWFVRPKLLLFKHSERQVKLDGRTIVTARALRKIVQSLFHVSGWLKRRQTFDPTSGSARR